MKPNRLIPLFTAIVVFTYFIGALGCEKKNELGENSTLKSTPEPTRMSVFMPQVAGYFYPSESKKLKNTINEYLDKVTVKPKNIVGELMGIIVPHAGYSYSGPVAAHAFGLLKGRTYKRVVVLAPAHTRVFSYAALLDTRTYRTPLGDIPIDHKGVKLLATSGGARIDYEKFNNEHAIEVELPFLQMVLEDFKLIPIMIGRVDLYSARKLAQALKKTFPANDTLFVTSTDMSHDYSYDIAVAMDKNALHYVSVLDTDGLYKAYLKYQQNRMNIRVDKDGKIKPDCAQFCGIGPVLILMELAKSFDKPCVTVLDRRNSGDIIGNKKTRIVGYSAVAVTLALGRPNPQKILSSDQSKFLTDNKKKELLKIARQTLETFIKTHTKPNFTPKLLCLNEPGAVFVTLTNHGRLRGCIGHMEPTAPLWKMVRDRTIDAATRDTRFTPVTQEELKDISIEISVLSPRVQVKNPLEEIKIGRDGVCLEIGRNRGVFLPQVPIEQNWTRIEQYLDNLCRKASIFQPGCWKSHQAKIERFSALVFSESENNNERNLQDHL